jgi:radical SAM protein with 4Fe4S-binding SPASM domain
VRAGDGAPGEVQQQPRDLAERLLLGGLDAMERFGRGLPAPLRQPWAETQRAWREKIHPALPEQHFLIPTGTPAFELLAWVAESVLDQPDGEPARQACEAMLAWYFALRIQDDIVDDGAPRELGFLEQVLTAHAVQAMVRAAGDAEAMLAFHSRIVRDFAAVAVADARQRADLGFRWDEPALAVQGRKYLPMAGPLGALLIRGGRPELLDDLVRMVEGLSTGLQLTNDLFGAAKDLRNGERSPYLAAMGLVPGLHGEADIPAAVRRGLRTGAHEAYIERIRGQLEASVAVLDLTSERLSQHVARRVSDLLAVGGAQRAEAVLRTHPLVADLEITRRCPLRCPHCFVRRQPDALAELPTSLVLEILEELSGYVASLHLTGGEPFHHPGIWEILERAVALGLRDMVINTGGTLLTPAALARLAATGARVELLVSLDGPPGVHDRARGPGTTQAALAAIRAAREHGLKASPSTVLTRELVAFGLEPWHAWLEEQLGEVGRLALWALFLEPDRAHPKGGIGHELEVEDLLEASRQAVALREQGAAVLIGDYPPINPVLAGLGVPHGELWQCGAGSFRLCVQADATVSPCHPLRLELGRVEAGRVGGFVARAFAHPHAKRLAAREAEGCVDCEHRSICGSCQAVVIGKGLEPFSNDGVCGRLIGRPVSDIG